MFILDSDELKSAMYCKDLKVEMNIELWHKGISHKNKVLIFKFQEGLNIHGLLYDNL